MLATKRKSIQVLAQKKITFSKFGMFNKQERLRKKRKKLFRKLQKYSDEHRDAASKNLCERKKTPSRTEIINYLLARSSGETNYLEIGVRNPDDNYTHIIADHKFSVDPGLEFESNPVDFKLTSDAFFEQLSQGQILSPDIQFDVIFIDGLHLADQVDRDIKNSLKYLKPKGFIALHDCNPPTEWHARENYAYQYTPATGLWNGTTWKAFVKWRSDTTLQSCCVDTDWGVGIFSKGQPIGDSITGENPYFEYSEFSNKRKHFLNLVSFEELADKLA